MQVFLDHIPALSQWVVPFLLVLGRIAGIFIIAPVISAAMVPVRYKALFAFMLALATFGLIGPSLKLPLMPDVFSLVPLIAGEALIGYVIGVIAAIPLLCLEMSGILAGQQMGLGLARVYNPETDIDSDVLGQLLYTIAAGAFIAFGGIDLLTWVLLGSFDHIPLGACGEELRVSSAPITLLVNALSTGFELAIRVSTPVSGAVMMMVIALGVIGKTMPQINIMSVGFTIKILAGLGALVFATYTIGTAAGEHLEEAMHDIRVWVESSDRAFTSSPTTSSPEAATETAPGAAPAGNPSAGPSPAILKGVPNG